MCSSGTMDVCFRHYERVNRVETTGSAGFNRKVASPKLRRAVHMDAIQHAMGAVLMQWVEGEQDPRPVFFLSR